MFSFLRICWETVMYMQEEVDPNDWTAKGFDNKAWLKEGIKLAQNKGNSQSQAGI